MELKERILEIVLARMVGEIQPEQEAELQCLLDKDPSYRKEYEEICSIIYSLRWLDKREKVDKDQAWKKLLKKHENRKRVRLFSISVVAASIVLLIGLFGIFNSSKEILSLVNNSVQENTEVTLVLSSGERVNVQKSDALEVQDKGLLIHADTNGLRYSDDDTIKSNEVVYNELIVPQCKSYQLRLADGSMVYLNADSKLRYPVNFSGNRREVYLEGEACFEITKDTLRPFVVHAAYTDIQVLGTLFNVSAYKAEEQTAVTLVNGKVEVSIGGKSNVLRPNEQYVLNHTTSEIKIRSVVASDYISWTQGLLCFDSMPLERLMMKLKRWYNISYEFKDQTLGNIRLTGGCHRGDDIHLIIEMLEELTDLTFTMEDQKVIIEKLKK